MNKYYVLMVFAALALWFVSRILNSPFGAVIEAIRENETRARACGYDVERSKLLSFILSGLICALAGALSALHLAIVPLDTLHYQTSGMVVMMTLLGGAGSFFGPFVGALAFLLMEDVFSRWTSHWQIIVGAVFILFVLFLRKGIWGAALVEASLMMNAPLLAVENIGCRFGSFIALEDVLPLSRPTRSPRSSARTVLVRAPSSTCSPAC